MDPHEETVKEATLSTTNTAKVPDSGACTGSARTGTAPEELAEEAPHEGPGEEAEGPLQGQELPVDEDTQPVDTTTGTAAVKKPKSMSGRYGKVQPIGASSANNNNGPAPQTSAKKNGIKSEPKQTPESRQTTVWRARQSDEEYITFDDPDIDGDIVSQVKRGYSFYIVINSLIIMLSIVLTAFTFTIARGVGDLFVSLTAAVGGAGVYCCWEPKLVVASVKIYLAWALLLYTPALVIADYVIELDLFPGNPFLGGVLGTQFILGLFIGGFMMPIPITAQWTVAPSPFSLAEKWKDIMKHYLKLNLLNAAVVIQVVTFVLDKIWLSTLSSNWEMQSADESEQDNHSFNYVQILVRPLILNVIRWGVAHQLWVFCFNLIASPKFKVEMMPQSFLFNAFMTTLAITFSNNWQAACANMMVDWLLFFLRFVKLRVLYMPEEEREKSKLASKMYNDYTKVKISSFNPSPGMDVRHLRGLECQVASMGMTSALSAMCMTYVVLVNVAKDSYVTRLIFGDLGGNLDNQKSREKFWYLFAALVQDMLQDFLISRSVQELSGIYYSRYFVSPFKSYTAFSMRLSVLVVGSAFFAPIVLSNYGTYGGATALRLI
mmetsp:Transcript_30047/g.80372  ORF Transcript_30047/g.80372 Transcript_30047/m.80372 type:complete len:605 (+) Transcript_30047:134-1948(+)